MKQQLLVVLASVALVVGCGDDDSAADTGAQVSSGQSTVASTGVSPDTGASTGPLVLCEDAVDAASCQTATNGEDDGPCTWMAIYGLSIDAAGACDFTPAERGVCVGTWGLDDGCNYGELCDESVDAYYTERSPGVWEFARGEACRGVSGFAQGMDTLEAPCSCACEMPPE